ncbi:MAG: tRNA lysidine(34) synthetase TilS [Betaproteobacteria bacterium]|nr:MAG: tRNA lysidine(34) synthetase TilS [Betaproteobacteria bacterium]
MASSRNSPQVREPTPHDAVAVVSTALAAALAGHVRPGASLAVALSGGLDSIVLLDAAAALAERHPIILSAIHVHHGLSPNADRWADFCSAQCTTRNVALSLHRLHLARAPGASLEAQARDARYECLLSAGVDVVALAHHADDQAETVLLQLLRGAGPQGLSAIPAFRPGHPALLRPLLDIPRTTLAEYASARALTWVEDESNTDRRHARNFIRGDVAPLLAARFPGYPGTLVRAARHQAEAALLANELALIDAAGAIDKAGLARARLTALPPARARNLLRWFLHEKGLRHPSEARLTEMMRQLSSAGEDARIRIAHDGAEIGSHRGRVAVHAPEPPEFERIWRGESEVSLPGGVLAFERARGAGLAAVKLERSQVTLRSRHGGERIRLAANRPTHAVKKLLQEARMPPWERENLPLIWSGDELVAVPGIGVALAFQAGPEEAGWRVEWRPSPTISS